MPRERIQKILAAAGFGSRRACEEMVADGRVSVNGVPVETLPCLVDPQIDRIAIDGKPVRPQKHVYYMLNKPPGYFCTHADPDGRPRAVDLMVGVKERLYPVGRLDADSLGLLIMTNDGELTQKLTHPRFATPKTYRVEVDGRPNDETLAELRRGVWLSDGKTSPAEIEMVRADRRRSTLEITLRESGHREIRRMLARFGHRVRRLLRIRMGKLSIRKLPVGSFRPLDDSEVRYLKKLADGVAIEVPATWQGGGRRHPSKSGSGPRAEFTTPSRGRKKPASQRSRGGPTPERRGGKPREPAQQRGGAKPGRRIILPHD